MLRRNTDAYLRRAIGKQVRIVFDDDEAAVTTLIGFDHEAIEVREQTRPRGYPSSLVFRHALISIQVVEVL